MRRGYAIFFAIVLVVTLVSTSRAAECPRDINPCKVMFLSPQQHQWLAGTLQSSQGSLLDAAAKMLGSDAAGVVAQVLMRAREAQDGSVPPKAAEAPAVEKPARGGDLPDNDMVRRSAPQ